MVTVQRVDGTAVTFEAADMLRIRRSALPLSRDTSLAVAIDIAGAEDTIYTREAFDDLVARLRPGTCLVVFTEPDGGAVAINATQVSTIQPNLRQVPGEARTILVVAGLRQAIQEPPPSAAALIAAAIAI